MLGSVESPCATHGEYRRLGVDTMYRSQLIVQGRPISRGAGSPTVTVDKRNLIVWWEVGGFDELVVKEMM